MNPIVELVLFTTLAGACIPLGGLIASNEHIRPRWLERELRHFIIALGGGVLLGAVALVLVPRGDELLGDPVVATLTLLAGGAAFMALDRRQIRAHARAPQLTAMLADFVPESLALGGMFAAAAGGSSDQAMLLALLIGLQNLPEGFNSWREMADASPDGHAVLPRMTLLVLLGPLAGLVGWYWLADHEAVLGGVMLFASGGILYLTFQDIAPQARLEREWSPPLGAVLGFGLALLGNGLIGHG